MIVNAYAFGAGGGGGGADVGYRVEVTVASSSVSSSLTDFPVYVDLSGMPAGFWTHLAYTDGRDIRVKDSLGNRVPVDVVRVDPIAKTGALFVKRSLSSSANTSFFVYYGDATRSAIAVTDTYGRNAVWSDYYRVFIPGENNVDRTGNGTPADPFGNANMLTNTSTSASLSVRNGVCFDGTHYYVTDTNSIKKYDSSFSLVSSNTDPCGDVGYTVNRCGDPCVVSGTLYVPVENYTNISTWSNQRIARFNASTLAYIDSVSVSAEGHEVSAITYNPDDGYLYLISYADGAALRRYNLSTLAYVSSLSLSTSITQSRGLTYWRHAFWINSESARITYRVESDGTHRGRYFGLSSGTYRGLGHSDDALLLLDDTTGSGAGVVRTLKPLTTAASGGVSLDGSSSYLLASGLTEYQTWTIGATAKATSKGQNRGVVTYDGQSSSGNSARASLVYRSSSDAWGIWNQSDSWLVDTISPSTSTLYRLHMQHTGTTRRRFYRNGANVQTGAPCTAKPNNGGTNVNGLFIGTNNLALSENFVGEIGFVYLRLAELSADWLAAESSNLSTPSSFYTVGTEESL